jgi:hypothetical protein
MNGVTFPAGFGTNCKNSVGLHNAHTSGGLVKVTYLDGVHTDTIYLAAGVYVACRVGLVWSTGTDAALIGKIHALY